MTYNSKREKVSELPRATQEAEAATLQWRVHPVLDQRQKALPRILLLLAVLLAVRLAYPEPLWTALAALFLFGSLVRYFFPTTYRLGDAGIEIEFLGARRRRSWKELRSYHEAPTGVLVSPFPKPHRLENFRGDYVMFAGNRETVLQFIREHIDACETPA